MNQVARSLLFFGLIVCRTCLANAREWTIDGTTKVQAEFSGIMGNTVFLSKASGSQEKFSLASLSAKDQAFIKNSEQDTTSVVASSPSPAFEERLGSQPIDMAPGGSKPLSFRRVIINIEPGTTVGKFYWGPTGSVRNVLAPSPSVGSEQYVLIARDELRKAHYNLLGGENLIFGNDDSAKARYELGAQISGLRLNIYATVTSSTVTTPPEDMPPSTRQLRVSGGTQTSSTTSFSLQGGMTTDWQVYDTFTHKVIYTHTTDIAVQTDLTDPSGGSQIFPMFRKSLRQLLANSEFTAFMKPGNDDENQAAKGSSFSSVLELTPFHHEKALTLPADFPALLNGVVTIKSGSITGAGFIITEDGYALTAAHVVSGLKTVSVCLHDGLVLDAEVMRVDVGSDVALIKLPGTSHGPLELTPDAPAVGVDVYAIGDPTGEELSSSVAKGIVSGEREILGHKFIQTDASINPGNSGGPLIGKDGRVLGIISRKIVGPGYEGLAFAVPIREVITKLNLKFAHATAK